VTRKGFYKLVFIISTFATIYSSNTSKLLRGLYHILPLPTKALGLTSALLTGCVLYLCLKAIGICDVIDCPHVPVWFLKRVLSHHVIAVTRFLLRMEITFVVVGDLIPIRVTGIGLKDTVNFSVNK
jgi:hypothetical protein